MLRLKVLEMENEKKKVTKGVFPSLFATRTSNPG